MKIMRDCTFKPPTRPMAIKALTRSEDFTRLVAYKLADMEVDRSHGSKRS